MSSAKPARIRKSPGRDSEMAVGPLPKPPNFGGLMGKSMKLGGGGRFQKLESSLASKPGIRNPAAVAASIGRKKYGAKKFGDLGAAAREKTPNKDGTY